MPRQPKLSPADHTPFPLIRTARVSFIMLLALIGSACNKTPTSPTSTSETTTTTTTTVASPTTTETFDGTLSVGGSGFYSFSVVENGTVNVTLTSVRGAGVPATVWVGLGIGIPSGEDCATTSSVNTAAGSAPQITGTYAPGVYCARIHDIGNLFAPATFSIDVAHP